MELTMGLLLVTAGVFAIIIGVRGRGTQAFDVLTGTGSIHAAPHGTARPARASRGRVAGSTPPGARTGAAGRVQQRAS